MPVAGIAPRWAFGGKFRHSGRLVVASGARTRETIGQERPSRQRNRIMATTPAQQPATQHRLAWSTIILAALIAASIDAVWFSTTAWLQGSSGYVVMQLTGGSG
jgi:hypothetical protein